jgi:hypothetical protein
VISVTDGKTTLRYQTRQTLFNIQPLMSEIGVVTMIDLEEINLSAAPGTSARKIRSGKKNVAKILARGQSIPSWKRSLAALRGHKRLAGNAGR